MALSDDDIRKGRNWSLFYKDGFALVGNAERKEQGVKNGRSGYEVETILEYYLNCNYLFLVNGR
jgi:hypothetical protein